MRETVYVDALASAPIRATSDAFTIAISAALSSVVDIWGGVGDKDGWTIGLVTVGHGENAQSGPVLPTDDPSGQIFASMVHAFCMGTDGMFFGTKKNQTAPTIPQRKMMRRIIKNGFPFFEAIASAGTMGGGCG